MTVQIALLRSVNVAGHGRLAMADLKAMMTKLGFTAETVIQSGNLVFASPRLGDAKLEALLEKEAGNALGITTDFFVRTLNEWRAILKTNPFPKEAKTDPGHLILMTLKKAPSRAEVEAVRAAIKGPERIQANGREAYIVYPAGVGTSKLSGALIERKLDTRGTARNWNTVVRLLAAAEKYG